MSKNHLKNNAQILSRRSGIYLFSVAILFVFIGMLTTVQPAYRFSSTLITEWTRDIDGFVFYNLLGMENRSFKQAFPEDRKLPELSNVIFQIATNLKPNDPRSLLGNELPGFSIYDSDILIAGEGTDYTNLPIESFPPLEEVLRDREAIMEEETEQPIGEPKEEVKQTTGKRNVVFIYNTHNRESFLPYLPDTTDPDLAHHSEMNITKVSDRLAEALKNKGIGTQIDHTDIGNVLDEEGLEYWQSYDASREVVEAAISTNKEIQYVFDLHRDAQLRKETTKEINGESYARIMFVVGMEHAGHEKNLQIATELNALIEENYPGLSRGVVPKQGAGTNGVFNQDLSENAILVEFGGVENTMEELYRSADALAEVFSDYYWDAEEVQGNP
ncbi:stage II sporulation protein P [Oceanobacillus massiliensis]|uniref:stage II sporulation protein P n=1 Tax=Oceanobacillus massiliensis TaxID=1465765 RepID=UPI000288D9D0|nr:stage II sporulation protein P [Oceanobacillus massiliensis]